MKREDFASERVARERRWSTDSVVPTLSFPPSGGMVQSWNKFCFTGGYLVASVRLPGRNGESQIAQEAFSVRTRQADPLSLSLCSLSLFFSFPFNPIFLASEDVPGLWRVAHS